MFHELRHAIRLLGRTPGFALTAILTLAVGIGATTGVYSIYSAVLLRPLPFGSPERLVAIWVRDPAGGVYGIAGGTLTAVRALPAVEHAALTIGTETTLLGVGEPEVVRGALVSDDFFEVLHVQPVVGRLLGSGDAGGTSSPVVLSHRLWQRRFHGDRSIVGRPLRLDDTVYTVVGVLPSGVRYPADAEYWAPYTLSAADLSQVGRGPYTALGRLRTSDVDNASAQAAALSLPTGDQKASSVMFVPLVESTAGLYRSSLTLLFGAVVMVLLIACFNVANLLLARNGSREPELAIRGAVGASRSRLLRQLVVESLVLSLVGAGAGMLFAQVIAKSVPLFGVPDIPRIDEVAIDWRVLMFAVSAAVASVCVFGVVPAWLASGRAAPALRTGRGVAGPRRRTASNLLIALQIAATLTLQIGSGLALTSLYKLNSVDLGFDTRPLTVTSIRPSAAAMKERPTDFHDRLLDRLRAQQGFDAVAAMSHVPLERVLAAAVTVTTEEGVVAREGRTGPRARTVTPGAFQALGVPIVHGRDFVAADRDGATSVAIVNETLARKLWSSGDPLGQSVLVDGRGRKRSYRVVGVARDFRPHIRRTPQPELYLAAAQEPTRLKILVRSGLPPDVVAARIRAMVLSEAPDVPITDVSTVSSLASDGAAYTRFHAILLTTFGVFGALLACSGILSVVTYAVSRRTREIGVRIAIGAAPRQVVRLLVGETTLPLVVGLVGGMFGVYYLAALLQQQGVLFEVSRFEPGLYAGAAVGLSILAIVAAWAPARVAALIDPMVALRSE